jgi:hypothetical protein
MATRATITVEFRESPAELAALVASATGQDVEHMDAADFIAAWMTGDFGTDATIIHEETEEV